MSRKYQGLIVLNTKALEGTVDELIGSISKEFEAEGAKIGEITQIGRRQFAYPPRHIESGHYVNYSFEGEAASVAKIQSKLRLNNHVHMQHFLRLS